MSSQLTFSQDESVRLLKTLSEIKADTVNHPILEEVFQKLETFINANKPVSTSNPAKTLPSISIYLNEDDKVPEKAFPGVHLLWLFRHSSKWANYVITWGLDMAGLPSGFVALPFLYGDVDEVLKDENSYTAIRQESQFVLIIRTSGIRDEDHYRITYDRISEYYRQRYILVPALDASDINTRLRVGHDPMIKQDFTRPIVPIEEMRFSVDPVIQNNELPDEALILKVVKLIQQCKSQRKIAQELGVPQARISRLIAKNKE
ncbi:hypothetical protein GCM10028803_46160 [Larkinella knui]|uniref:Uncharacterized protein n=1 Tax=Larkinella knui TaxID=2025310 RepID=A0A3P1CQH6_9BACT|nr:hypothetical protein [Larkinella knui]RRB15214.1 hypothetical protein EHT87_11770 [Larkinella knui]